MAEKVDMRPHAKWAALVCVVGAAAFVAARAGASDEVVSIAVDRESPKTVKTAGTRVIHDGADPQIAGEFFPDSVVVGNNREMLAYHAEFTSRASKTAGIAWTILLVDDAGNVVNEIDRGSAAIPAAAAAASRSFALDVPDGYYSLRGRAAMHSADGDFATLFVQYLVVTGGKMREIDYEAWHAASRDIFATLEPGSTVDGGSK